MLHSKQSLAKLLRISERLYLFLVFLSFYLLFSSRAGEARTVWEVLHPVFIPTLFVATSLLIAILLTSEKVAYKLLFIIVHSVLIHSLFSIVFPAGDLSGQQMTLGRIRLVYDNAILHGWSPWPVETVQSQVYQWFRGENFQAALSVGFARMLSIDLLWVHLFFVPVLWGVFTPIAAYLTTYTFTKNEKVAVLASLLLSVFPYTTYFGAISVPNSLGFIFFLYTLYFMLKYLDSNDSKTTVWMLVFSFFSLLSHSLTGIMSLSLLLLAITFKIYRDERSPPTTAKILLVTSFILSASLLPLSLYYLRFFRPRTFTAFTLDKFHELPFEEIVGQALLGDLIYSTLEFTLLIVIGPALALLYMIHRLYGLKRNPAAESRIHLLFLSAAFLLMVVDYRILKLFMELGGLINEERLWVFRDFISVPFVALAIYSAVSSVNKFLRASRSSTTSIADLRKLSKRNVLRFLALLFTLNVLIPTVLGGWTILSLRAAYPQFAPLQTTWYELEAVKYIEENTNEKYVVISDIWTIFAGETIVGIENPRAYYFKEFNETGHALFVNMVQNPDPQWMLLAMNYTDTTIAYFIVTEPRFPSPEEFQEVVARVSQNQQITLVEIFGDGKLYVFSYRKGGSV